MKGRKMVKIIIGVLLAALIAALFVFCKKYDPQPQPQPQPGPGNDTPDGEDRRCDLNQFRYTETGPDGEYSIFLDQTYGRARYVVHDRNGEDRQYYVSNQVLFDLYDYMLEQDFENWRYLDSENVEAEGDTVIKIEYRINGMSRDFGSRRMPKGGIELLRHFTQIAAGYENDDNETKPFKVKIGGKEYWTKRGTGNSVGMGAVIDFGDDKWWIVEKFVGHYELTEKSRKVWEKKDSFNSRSYGSATLDIYEDGRLVLKVDDDDPVETTVDEDRLYGCYATAMYSQIDFLFCSDEDKGKRTEILEFRMRGLPYPETFAGYELYLEKIK